MQRSLSASDNLFDFFHDRVLLARQAIDTPFHDDTVLYLAQLLAERARVDEPADSLPTTLAELHGSAAHAPPGQQASTYRELGDRALYLLGFFREHLDRVRRPVGPSYYIDMGSAAYHRCDQVFKRWFADAFGPVFHELSRHFEACVSLLSTVRAQASPDDLARAYQRWLIAADAIPSDDGPSGLVLLGSS